MSSSIEELNNQSNRSIINPTSSSSSRTNMNLVKMTSSQKARRSGIDVNDLPYNLKKVVSELKLDTDGNGRLDTKEIVMAVEHLVYKTKANASLKKIVMLLCGFSVFLVAALFGASIAAARLAKDTEMDPITGVMYAKGDAHSIMKTKEAIFIHQENIALMTNDELNGLKAIIMTSGDVKFQVKGYSRSGTTGSTGMNMNDGNNNQVMVVVEGGTITYDSQGIMDASGDAERLLTFTYGDFTLEEEAPVEVEEEAPTNRRRRRHLERRLEDVTGTDTVETDRHSF